MKNIQILCNTCGRDLTATTNCIGYRLALVVEHIPPVGEVLTLMSIDPPIDAERHYCGVKCLVGDKSLRDAYTGVGFNTGENK